MTVHVINNQNQFTLDVRRIKSLTRLIMRELNLDDRQICVLLTDDEGIKELNDRYLNRHRPTNVLSFPMNEGNILGDIAISVETAARDADEGGIPLFDEIIFLIIHGLLHLAGYEHEDGDEVKAHLMQEKERQLFHAVIGYQID